MKTTRNEDSDPEPAIAPVPTGRNRAGWIALLLAATGGVAWATEGEKYPDYDDETIESRVTAWKGEVPGYSESLCTGTVTRSDSQSTRDPIETTPNVPEWAPIDDARLDGSSVIEERGGGDTDDVGTDSFLYVKLVGLRANLFATVILEAEDGATSEWKVRYRGTETLTYENGPLQRGDVLEVTNPWSIGWTRRVVDYDAKGGDYEQEKSIDQAFAVRCDLVDGSSVGDGAKFHRVVPATESSTTSVPLKLKFGAKAGDGGSREGGFEAGFEEATTKTYDTHFSEETLSSGEMGGVAKVKRTAPCPFSRPFDVATTFGGDFAIRDHAGWAGDLGSRQELRLTVINEISGFVVSGCHDCGTPPPPRDPTSPVTPPPPRTPGDPQVPDPAVPGDPERPVTPSDGSLPVGPVITPRAGEEPGFAPEPVTPSTSGPRPLVGPDDLPVPPTAPPVAPTAPWEPPVPTPADAPLPPLVPIAASLGGVPADRPVDGPADGSPPR